MMKEEMQRFTLRIPATQLQKLGHIAEWEGRTKNREIQQLIKQRIARWEEENGPIPVK